MVRVFPRILEVLGEGTGSEVDDLKLAILEEIVGHGPDDGAFGAVDPCPLMAKIDAEVRGKAGVEDAWCVPAQDRAIPTKRS